MCYKCIFFSVKKKVDKKSNEDNVGKCRVFEDEVDFNFFCEYFIPKKGCG